MLLRRALTAPHITRCQDLIDVTNHDDLYQMAPNPSVRIFRPHSRLLVAFDVRLRTPVYALEKLVIAKDPNSNEKRRRHRFFEEDRLEEYFRNRNHHFTSTGYDRGHMAPAADFEPSEEKATYTLANIVPQNSVMNRTIWAHLERWTRQVARSHANSNSDVYVVTGPLWLPTKGNNNHITNGQNDHATSLEYNYPALGTPPSMIHVPTHLFKVVVVVKDRRIIQYACFVVPNHEDAAKLDLKEVVVPWTALEAVTGLTFFPMLTKDPKWKRHVDHQSLQVQDARRHRSPLLLPPSNTKASPIQGVEHLCRLYSCQRPDNSKR